MKPFHAVLGLLLLAWLSAAAAVPAPETPPAAHDIRILIDVSGSMKKNDPANLRIPALRLLTGLLPAGTQAGVWTFGRYVNMLVPYGAVDTPWRDRAMAAADRINSAGLYTDIEAALTTATWNWTGDVPGARRSLILLTDGLVDVADNADADRQSRSRLTDSILPRLHAAGVAVYAIALSDGSDEALLQQLAASSGGAFERAESADQLERIFFRMFEKAAAPDTLPLVDNQILVDDSIDEITVLVFRKQGAPATTLTTPDGTTVDPAHLPANARWHNDARYDLVTIDQPRSGTWHVNADVDPDNRVMVVSNLRVLATQLPNQILQGDAYDFLVRFTEKDRPILSKDFLQLLKVTLREDADGDAAAERLLLDNGRDGDITAGDGTFGTRFDATAHNGRHTVIVDVDGTTFKRQRRQEIEVVESPVIADLREVDGTPTLFVIPRTDIINPDTLEAYATVTDTDSVTDSRRLTRTAPGEWRLSFDGYSPDTLHQVAIEIEAERLNGKPLSYRGKPLFFGRPAVTAAETPSAAAVDETEAVDDTESAPEEEDTGEAVTGEDKGKAAAPAPAHINWALVIALVVLINVLLGGGLFLLYRKVFGSENAADSTDTVAEKPPAESPPAAAAVPPRFDNAQPSIVSQLTEAAAAENPPDTVLATAPAAEEAAAEPTMESAAPAADAHDDEGHAAAARAAAPDTLNSDPELVLEDDAGQDMGERIDERLKNLNVDEIDLGFEEKTRSTG